MHWVAFLFLLAYGFGVFVESPRAAPIQPIARWNNAMQAKMSPEEAYEVFKGVLDSAAKAQVLPELFDLYFANYLMHSKRSSSFEKNLRRRWATDAVRQKQEAIRVLYARLFALTPPALFPMAQTAVLKLRPGENLEIDWAEVDGNHAPPKQLRVEWAEMRGQWHPDSMTFGGGGAWAFRKYGSSYSIRESFAKPGLYRITLHSPDFFSQAYAIVSSLDLRAISEAKQIHFCGTSPHSSLSPPYRVHWLQGSKNSVLATDSNGCIALNRDSVHSEGNASQIGMEKQGHWAFLQPHAWEAPRPYAIMKGVFFTNKFRYDPGDTVQIVGWIKRHTNSKVDDSLSADSVRITLRNGHRLVEYRKHLPIGELGHVTDAWVLPNKLIKGRWYFETELIPTSEHAEPVAYSDATPSFWVRSENRFSGQPRFRVNLDAELHGLGDSLTLQTQATTQGGKPLAHRPIQLRVVWDAKAPMDHDRPGLSQSIDSLRLNDLGYARVTLTLPNHTAGLIPWVIVTIQDTLGDSVISVAKARVVSKSSELKIVATRVHNFLGKPVSFSWARGPISLHATRPEDARFQFQIHEGSKVIWDTILTCEPLSQGVFRWTPKQSGHYQWTANPFWGGRAITQEMLVTQVIGQRAIAREAIEWPPLKSKPLNALPKQKVKVQLKEATGFKEGEIFGGVLRITDGLGQPMQAQISLALVDLNLAELALSENGPIYLPSLSHLGQAEETVAAATTSIQFEGESFFEEWPFARPAVNRHPPEWLSWILPASQNKKTDFTKSIPSRRKNLKLIGLSSNHHAETKQPHSAGYSPMTCVLPPRHISSLGNANVFAYFSSPGPDIGYWNSSLRTDAKGEVRFRLPIPREPKPWLLWVRGMGPGDAVIDYRIEYPLEWPRESWRAR